MVFSSLDFVLLLPVFLLWFYAAPTRAVQNAVLFGQSAFFVAYSGIWNLVVVLAVMGFALSYFHLRFYVRADGVLRAAVIAVIILNLCYFKFDHTFLHLAGFDLPSLPDLAWGIPLGISFYTFQIIGAIVDTRAMKSPLGTERFSLFVLFFPQLIAGPIVKFRSLAPQFDYIKRFRLRNLKIGLHLFALGYAKKVFIADPIGRMIDPIWASPGDYSSTAAALAVVGFYAQLFADFSGYTDMGRGIARMMGFRLPINFRAPYLAHSPTDFWNRWHITLIIWMRQHLYNPLAISLVRFSRTPSGQRIWIAVSVIVTVTAIGVWHGAVWGFIFFGIFHGVLYAIWNGVTSGRAPTTRRRYVIAVIIMQVVLLISLIVFRGRTPENISAMFGVLLDWQPGLTGHADLWLCLPAVAVVLVIQAVDYHATTRRVARRLCAFRTSTIVMGVLVIAYISAVGVQLAQLGGVLGWGTDAMRTRPFVYFAF